MRTSRNRRPGTLCLASPPTPRAASVVSGAGVGSSQAGDHDPGPGAAEWGVCVRRLLGRPHRRRFAL
eukprot:5720952-Lingulodinium_polyedra.AAC.1